MKNFMFTVLNAEIPVMNIVVNALMAVQYVVRLSVKRVV
jgi:hypothetical protein